MAEITRTYYSVNDEVPAKGKPFQLDVDTLVAALSKAIDYAKEPNAENYNACCLQIYADGTFWISERCYANTSFSRFKSNNPCYSLTVPATAYPAQAWGLSLTEFCGYYGIKISTVEWSNDMCQPVPAMWDQPKVKEVHEIAQRTLFYLADLNGSPWIKGDGTGEVDMRQRAKGLQNLLYKALNNK